MSSKDIILPFEMETFDAADLDATFQAINEDGFPHACCYMRLLNESDTDVTVSFDGVTDHDFVPADDKLEIYFQISSRPNNQVSFVAKGTKIYVSGGAQATGTIYLIGYYRPQGN